MKTEIHIYGREILTGRQTDRQTDEGPWRRDRDRNRNRLRQKEETLRHRLGRGRQGRNPERQTETQK